MNRTQEINQGVFSWKKRYAIHRMFHQNRANQIAHLIGTPLQLFSFIKLFSLCYIGGTALGAGFNLGLLFISLLAFVYCRVHLWIGLFVTAFLVLSWYVASYVLWSSLWYVNVLIAIAFFILGVLIQVGVGHKIFQKQKTNLDTEFAEFFQTLNPLIIILIFLFPFLDFFYKDKVVTPHFTSSE